MKKMTWMVMLAFLLSASGYAQETKVWTEEDRQYLIENLVRSRDELLNEINGLSPKQWSFKESSDRWSINEVVEHLAIWELCSQREMSRSLSGPPQPELNNPTREDSYYSNFIMEEKPHITTEYTKPFTYTVPMGNNELKNNVAWLLKMRNESIEYLKIAKEDLRSYYRAGGKDNLHQWYIYVFGHVDRHLRQIKKIKQHTNYPK